MQELLLWRRPIIALVAGVGLAVVFLASADAADSGKTAVETVPYGGWKNNLKLSNGFVELIVTLEVGPRVISYKSTGGKNVFKEYADQLGKTGEKTWQIRGGHRLWVGPEDLTRTYALDNGPVKYKALEGGAIRFTPAPDTEYGIQREFDVSLASTGSQVTVVHRITNVGEKPTSLAPWVLTVMAPGGIEIIPLPPHHPHPGDPKNARSPADFAPNETMILWPFFDFKDPRWSFGSKYITLKQDAKMGPTKIGLAHQMGWIGYLNGNMLFVKRFDYQEGKHYPDRGCNFETFTNQDMLEMESLGPVVELAPGAKVEHTERWELFGSVPNFVSGNEESIDENVLSRVKGK